MPWPELGSFLGMTLPLLRISVTQLRFLLFWTPSPHPALRYALDMTFLLAPRTPCIALSPKVLIDVTVDLLSVKLRKLSSLRVETTHTNTHTRARTRTHPQNLWVLGASTEHLAQEVFVERVRIAESVCAAKQHIYNMIKCI